MSVYRTVGFALLIVAAASVFATSPSLAQSAEPIRFRSQHGPVRSRRLYRAAGPLGCRDGS